MVGVRRAIYRMVFFGLSVPIVLAAPIAAAFGQQPLQRFVIGWLSFHRWCVRHLLGVSVRVEGTPLTTPALYAAKHQAMFETFELTRMLNAPAIVMKRELASIPVWGWAARRYGVIVVDRDASANALRAMMRDAKAALAAGRSVVIFPEGTRVAPGERPPLKSGFAGLYRALALPAVPVALDTGFLRTRNALAHRDHVTFRFGETVPPGLPRKAAEAIVHAGINALEGDASPLGTVRTG